MSVAGVAMDSTVEGRGSRGWFGRRVKLGSRSVQLGLHLLLVALTGGAVGVAKLADSLMAGTLFDVPSQVSAYGFLVAFGLAKAGANLGAGVAGDRAGRRTVLALGFALGTLCPIVVWATRSWAGVLVATTFLGAQQGLCWSATVMCTADLAGARRRTLLVGCNEAVGYASLAILQLAGAALIEGADGQERDLLYRPYALVLALLVVGGLASWGLVKETLSLAQDGVLGASLAAAHDPWDAWDADDMEGWDEEDDLGGGPDDEQGVLAGSLYLAERPSSRGGPGGDPAPRVGDHSLASAREAWADVRWTPPYAACCLAGLLINVLTATSWALTARWAGVEGQPGRWAPLGTRSVAAMGLAYSLPKALGMVPAGALGDRRGARWPVVAGLGICALGLGLGGLGAGNATTQAEASVAFVLSAMLVGAGTALVYPNAMVAAANLAPAACRAEAIGLYRFWRDLGYAVGGFALGISRDVSGSPAAVVALSGLSAAAGTVVFAVAYKDKEDRAARYAALVASQARLLT